MRKNGTRMMLWNVSLFAVVLLMPALTVATVPPVMSFQAILLDDQGQIVPDSSYEIEFGIYPASTGVPAIWQEVQIVMTSGGVLNAMLGTVSPLSSEIFIGETWLQMRLTASPEPYLPRTRIGATPYSYNVQSIDQSKGGQISGKLIVDTLEVGHSGVPGRFSVIQDNSTIGTSIQPYGSLGSALRVNDELGNACVQLRPDNSGEGGWIYVHRNAAGGAGFTVEGNTGTFEPSVRITGSTQSAEFNLSQAGNNSVALPVDAIGASEILDEPGIAANLGNGVWIDAMRKNIISRTITPPTDGYVLAIATVELLGFAGGADSMIIGLTNSPTTWPYDLQFEKGWTIGRSEVLTVSGTFPVTAGSDVFYLAAGWLDPEAPINMYARNSSLSLIFLPTSYGTVTPPASAGQSGVTALEAATGEFSESKRTNGDRIERELAEMKTRLLELEKAMADQDADKEQR